MKLGLVFVIAISAALLAAFTCAPKSRRATSPTPVDERAADAPTPDAGILRGLQKFPVSDYPRIEEAEAVAGYAIPKPSSDYPNAQDSTSLEGFPGTNVRISRTLYVVVPPPSLSTVEVTVEPGIWKGGSDWSRGDNMTVGIHTGWLQTQARAFWFAYQCGSVDDETLWCVVHGSTDLGKDRFLAFVATLS